MDGGLKLISVHPETVSFRMELLAVSPSALRLVGESFDITQDRETVSRPDERLVKPQARHYCMAFSITVIALAMPSSFRS